MARDKGAETQLLRDETVYPDESVLKRCLGSTYPIYGDLMRTVRGDQHGLVAEWRYYRDGKAWLCKVTDRKKKTVFWLSVWDGYFRVSMYFTEKHRKDIEALDLSPEVKVGFRNAAGVGRLIPLIMKVKRRDQLKDVAALIEYRKRK